MSEKIDEEDFQEKRWQLLEWIYEVDQITDSEARSQLVDEIKSMPQEIRFSCSSINCLCYSSNKQ